jgi:hypothetical protein
MLGCTLGISANTDSICQAKGIQPPIPYKQMIKNLVRNAQFDFLAKQD